jgi:hypothetical protein
MVTLAQQWVRPTLISSDSRDATTRVFLPELGGIIPGFGRFSPCPWGLGPQLRGDHHHWMGEWPPSSFGHFGKSGAMVLVNVDDGLALVATSTVDFGGWARDLWPRWTTEVRRFADAS